jgi:hypothetical protein
VSNLQQNGEIVREPLMEGEAADLLSFLSASIELFSDHEAEGRDGVYPLPLVAYRRNQIACSCDKSDQGRG